MLSQQVGVTPPGPRNLIDPMPPLCQGLYYIPSIGCQNRDPTDRARGPFSPTPPPFASSAGPSNLGLAARISRHPPLVPTTEFPTLNHQCGTTLRPCPRLAIPMLNIHGCRQPLFSLNQSQVNDDDPVVDTKPGCSPAGNSRVTYYTGPRTPRPWLVLRGGWKLCYILDLITIAISNGLLFLSVYIVINVQSLLTYYSLVAFPAEALWTPRGNSPLYSS